MADKQIEIELVANADLDGAEELRDLIEEIKAEAEEDIQLDSNADEVAGEFDDLTESAEEATESMGELQDSMDLLEASALMGIASELSNMGAQAEGMAQEMNTAAISVGQLSTNVGMAEPQMVSLINNISNATFPQSEAMAYANALNQMGVSADRLGESATNMDRINDATGIGYQKTMQLTQGLQAVGISADNLPASFNAIAYAQSNVNGGADTLSMVLKRQASTINEYGLNVDQLVIIMQKLSEQGVQGMKMGSELSKVLKATNGNTVELEKSLGLQAGALSNASNVTGQYSGQLQNLANEEAEHKTWLDQINAAWEDMQLSLSPILSPLTSFMGLIGQAGSWAVGVNGLIQLAQTTRASAAAQWLLNIAMDANPIMIVVLAVMALIAVLTYLYFNNEQVRAAIDALGQTFMWVGQIIYTTIMNAISFVTQTLQGFWEYIVGLGGNITGLTGSTSADIINAIVGFLAWWWTLPAKIAITFVNIIAKALGFGDNFVQNLASAAVNAANNFISNIASLPGRLQTELSNMLSAVEQWAATLPQKFWDAGVEAVQNFLSALGIASPGTMQRMLIWEVSEMGRRVPEEGEKLVSNIKTLGSDVVDNFGNPSLSLGYEDTANASIIASTNALANGGGQNIFFTFNDTVVDNEDRMEAIANYITRKLAFNNETAGRTI